MQVYADNDSYSVLRLSYRTLRISSIYNIKIHDMQIDCGCATSQYIQWTSNYQFYHAFSIQLAPT